MPTRRRIFLALLAGFALGLLLTLGGVGLARSGVLQALPGGPPPAAPTFPERVVEGPMLRGDTDILLSSLGFGYSALIRAHLGQARPDFDQPHVLRHRSLQLPDFGLGHDDDPGLVASLLADAETKGWEVVPELTVDAGVAYQAVGLRQGRWLFLVLAFGDRVAQDRRQGVADDLYACCTDGGCPPAPEPGLAPCPMEGFVPVYIWTNLPRASFLQPGMEALEADDRAWADPPTWEEHVARRPGDG